ncbi:Peptidyl-prolyl cis-trans isomerase FKBP16-1, chloroplastic, partial [Tetrabaena socialis]
LLAPTIAAAAALATLPPAAAAAKAPAAATADPGDWSSPGLGVPVDPTQPQFVRLPSGVRYQQLNVGSGPAAGSGDTVLFDYVLRRSNGYFIYGTIEGISFQPRDVPTAPVSIKLGSGELIPGLEEVLLGMSPGTKRRALVPPELGYVGGGEQPQPPTFATKRQLETHRRRVGGRAGGVWLWVGWVYALWSVALAGNHHLF